MKKLIGLLSVMVLISCDVNSGNVGPRGPKGPPGDDGAPGTVGQGFEVDADFNQSNEFAQIFSFPEDIEVLDTDIVAVYLLFEVDQETGSDVWQSLPASFFFDDGELQYGFDHTLADVRLFLQGNIDFTTLGPDYTEDQIFRVAILPVDYVQSNKINLENMDEVMGAVKNRSFERLKLKNF